MRVAIVTFCRGSDSELLAVSNETLKLNGLTGEDFPRVLIDEDKSALPNTAECDHYLTREFSRGSTLDGMECTVGMLTVYQEIARLTQCDYILKIDCDVLVLSTKFLSVLRTGQFYHYGHGVELQINNVEGKVIKVSPYCQGAAYAISSKIISQLPTGRDALTEQLRDADSLSNGVLSMPRSPGVPWPEDEAISWVLWSLCRESRRFGWEHQDAKFGHLGEWSYARNGATFSRSYFDRLRVFDFVECGKTSGLAVDDYPEFRQRRAVSLSIMKQALEVLRHS
jgi:hypothetical protein